MNNSAAIRSKRPSGALRLARGFTLIEIMITVSIMAIFMAIGVPAMFRAMERNQLARAIKDTIEGCKTARDRAILQGVPHAFVLRPDGQMQIEKLPMEQQITHGAPGGSAGQGELAGPYSGFPRQLGEDVIIQLIDVNFINHMEMPAARARFFPNGISDEFTVVFSWLGQQRSVTVDIVTGLAYELIKQ